MSRIILMRHAESEVNANSKITVPRRINSRLSSRGTEQAEILDFSFDLLIVTPLKRSMETYINSNIKTSNVLTLDIFREHKSDPVSFLELEEISFETKEQLKARVAKAVNVLRKLSLKYKNIGIISHYSFLKYFTGQVMGKKLEFNNCEYAEFTM